jgi:hypothetical protein
MWQPIETAPKDGTNILGWYGGDEQDIHNVYFDTEGWGTWTDAFGEDKWATPLMWMPLPEPPLDTRSV